MSYVIRTQFDGYSADGARRYRKGGGGPSAEESARAAAAERQKNVQAAQSVVDKYFTPTDDNGNPFTDKWYTNQRQSYSDYYLPDLEKQYQNARSQLEMNLAQTNPYGSSTNVASMQRLEDEYNKQYASLLQNADNFVADLRNSVADARTSAMSGAGDVSLATTAKQSADAAAAAASVPAFSPLGQLFANMVQPTMTGLSSAATQSTGTNSNSGGTTLFGSTKGGSGVKLQGSLQSS